MSAPGTITASTRSSNDDQVGYDDDGVLCQLVGVIMTDDAAGIDPAVCLLTAAAGARARVRAARRRRARRRTHPRSAGGTMSARRTRRPPRWRR